LSADRVLAATGVRHACRAVAACFVMSGFGMASLLSRVPGVRNLLGLSWAQLGLLLLCVSGGSMVGLPLSGLIVHRFGPGRSLMAASLTVTAGFLTSAAGLRWAVVAPVAMGFVLIGLGVGVWDVAMNVEGTDIERRLGRSLMPRLHAAFSVGTMGGAGVGAVAAAVEVPLAVQMLSVAALVPISTAFAARFFLPVHDKGQRAGSGDSGVMAAWREPRTVLIGVLVFGFAFIEGSANDWVAVAMVDGHGMSEALGAIAFGTFVSAMTLGRLLGGSAVERLGRVAVLRVTASVTLAGLLLVLFGRGIAMVLVGTWLWGFGASLGFPVGMSAAADDPARAAARVSVVSSIGYTAFLAGSPLIGLVAESVGILRALLVVLGAVALGLLASGALRPLPSTNRSFCFLAP
jgi:predicted MFS family arabinose efflux permease